MLRLPKLVSKVPVARRAPHTLEVSFTFIHLYLLTFFVDLMCDTDNLQLLETFFVTQNQSE